MGMAESRSYRLYGIPRRQERGPSFSGSRLPANPTISDFRDVSMCLRVNRITLFPPEKYAWPGELSTSHRTWSIISAYQLLLIKGQGWKGRLGPLKCQDERGWHSGGRGADGLVSEWEVVRAGF